MSKTNAKPGASAAGPKTQDALPWQRLALIVRSGTVPVVEAPTQMEALLSDGDLRRLRRLGEEARNLLQAALDRAEQAKAEAEYQAANPPPKDKEDT